MSGIFHKSCYTSRSSGYKYRTLSTNTGDRKRRCASASPVDGVCEHKFAELRTAILTKINQELEAARKTRYVMQIKCEKVENKINNMVDFQAIVMRLRKELRSVEYAVLSLAERVEKLDVGTRPTSVMSYSTNVVNASLRGEPFQAIAEGIEGNEGNEATEENARIEKNEVFIAEF